MNIIRAVARVNLLVPCRPLDAIVDRRPPVGKISQWHPCVHFLMGCIETALICAATFLSLLRLEGKKASPENFLQMSPFVQCSGGPIRQILREEEEVKRLFKRTGVTAFGIHCVTCCPSDVLHSQIGVGEN